MVAFLKQGDRNCYSQKECNDPRFFTFPRQL